MYVLVLADFVFTPFLFLINTNNLFISNHMETHIGHSILEITDIRMPASSTVSTLDLGE